MRSMEVLLLNPPSPRGCRVNREGMGGLGLVVSEIGFVYPALLLAEMQASLKSFGASVRALDQTLQPSKPAPQGAHVLVMRVALASLEHDLGVAVALQRHLPDAQLVLLGTALAARAAQITAALPHARLLDAVDGHAAAATLAGCSPSEPDETPDADWSGLSLGEKEWLPLQHHRGCMHECVWCPYTIATGRRLLRRSPERTARECAALVALHKPRRVVFRDPLFGSDTTDALLLLSLLAASPQRAPIEVETRPECVTAPLAEALRHAGCVELKLGIDTLEPQVLETQRRLLPGCNAADYRERVRQALAHLDAAGVPVRCYLLQNLPGATTRGEAEARAALGDRHQVVVKTFIDPAALMMARG